MEYSDLRSALTINDSTVSIMPGSLTSNIDVLLRRCYSNRPIVIAGATPSSGDDQNNQVVIQGHTNWLNIDSLPITATFGLDNSGNVQMQLVYTLIGASRGNTPWLFSQSFPDLPDATDYALPDPSFTATIPYDFDAIPLDQLLLFNTSLTVRSNWSDGSDSAKDGFFFTSDLTPSGVLGILESTVGDSTTLTLNGTIYIPADDEITPPLHTDQMPWNNQSPVPGINLKASLNLNPVGIGPLQFAPQDYRVYTPHSWQWYEQHTDYKPCFAYTGQFTIPSASVTVGLTGVIYMQCNAIWINGLVQGVSIQNLASLVDVAGTNQLDSEMPAQLQPALAKLATLQLTQVGVMFSTNTEGFSTIQASFTIGFPDLNWEPWDSNIFVVNTITAQFIVTPPFSSANLTVMVLGKFQIEGVPLDVQASNVDSFTLLARVGAITVPVRSLLQTYLNTVDPPSDLTINSITAVIAPKQNYALTVTMAAQPNPWVIDVGPGSLTISNVYLFFSKNTDGSFAGNFSGTIAFSQDVYMSASYVLPGDFMVRADVPKISLSTLIHVLSSQSVELPSGFDLTFANSSVLIQEQSGNFTFLFGTQLVDLGSFAFQAVKQSDGWGVAAGVALQVNPSQVAGLEVFGQIEKFLATTHLKQFVLVISSFENAQFTFPEFRVFNNPLITGANVPLPANTGVIRGLNVYAQWLFDPGDQHQSAFLKLLHITNLSATVVMQLGGNPLGNEADLFLKIATTIAGQSFAGRFGVQYKNEMVTLFLDGTLQFTIDNKQYQFYIGAGLVANGIFITGSLSGQQAIDFDVFQLENVALFVGVDWEGIPSLGIAATIAAIGIETSIAILFNANIPSQSIVAGSISGLTLRKILDVFTSGSEGNEMGQLLDQVSLEGMAPAVSVPDNVPGAAMNLSAALDGLNFDVIGTALTPHGITVPGDSTQRLLIVDQPGQHWFLTTMGSIVQHYELRKDGDTISVVLDPQIYIVPQATQIGLMSFNQGLFLNGKLSVFGYFIGVMINVNSSQGIIADAQMSSIIIYDPDLFSVTNQDGSGGPKLSLATYRQDSQTQDAYKNPHLLVDGQIIFLGLKRNMLISVTSDGFVFDIEGQLFQTVSFNVHAHFNGPNDFGAGGSITIGVSEVNIPITDHFSLQGDLNASAELDVKYEGNDLTAQLSFSYTIGDRSGQITAFDLDIHTAPLANLPDLIVQKVKDHFLHADIDLHVDNPVQPHLDNPGTDHQDSGGVHTDQPGQSSYPNHIDHTINDWRGNPTNHQDEPGDHQDQPGIDSTTEHTDIPGIAHNDQPAQHQDQGYHVDQGKETVKE